MAKTPPPASKLVAKPPRKLKASKYQSFKLQKSVAPTMPPMRSAWSILLGTLGLMKRNWKLFAGIMIVFGVLTAVLVRGFSLGTDLSAVKDTLSDSTSGNPSEVLTGTALFAYLIGSSGNTSNDGAGVFQIFVVLIVSLALIWSFRQVHANNPIRVRDGFYAGMYPLVPFLLVLSIVILQFLPMLFGGFLYSLVGSNPSVTSVELLLWGFVFFLLVLVTLYMLTSSLFALYIVCLPNMGPGAALRAARDLVRYRRWVLLRKIVFLPVVLLAVAAVIMIPLIMLAPSVAMWIFFIISMAGLPIIHGYMYGLYRELL